MRYRLKVRLTPADVGQRVVIRWRRPSPGDGEQIADVLGILEENDSTSFAVRTSDGALVVIPAARALAGKVVPPAPQNRRRASPKTAIRYAENARLLLITRAEEQDPASSREPKGQNEP